MTPEKALAIQKAKALQALIGIAEVSIILNTFIKAFKFNSINKNDKVSYLHGNFNLGGTKSGRLSSNGPNLQNIPSTGNRYADYIKQCFIAPPDQLMIGADFSSLEDKISALTTKDPNKLKVYTDGYDGHSLRAFNYFRDSMPDINSSVNSINSIDTKYSDLRQRSKGPTFALTYGGTSHALVNQCGIPLEEAKLIEAKYHELYKVSDDWVSDKINKGAKVGHVVGAFGLWLRTPIIQQTLLNKRSTPYESSAEARTAGNMLGQSYGLLNNRAGIEFQERVLKSKYKYDIMPIAQIHDSMYFLVQNSVGCVKWFNDNLIECMEWQNLPELQHPTVKLGGNVEIYYPDWSVKTKLKNRISKADILNACLISKVLP